MSDAGGVSACSAGARARRQGPASGRGAVTAGLHETRLTSGEEGAAGIVLHGCTVPLFLGGRNDVTHLELSDLDVSWTAIGQILAGRRP